MTGPLRTALVRVARAIRHLNSLAKLGLCIVVGMVLASIFVPILSPYDPNALVGTPFQPPGSHYWFGTDDLGRDIFTRTFAAGRVTMSLAVVGVLVPLFVGTLLGAMIGTSRLGWVSGVWTMIIDGINAFPLIVLIIAIVAVTGPGVIGLLTAILLTNWARYARVARARAVMVSKAEYVQSLSLLGYSRTRIVFRHVVPNTWTETRAYALSDFVVIVISVAGLSFLGLGIRPPQAEWGAMISEGRLYLQEAWWMIAFPGIALSVVATGVALLADSRSSVAADSMKALA
jgi:peptide/nickel transport system permease protein